MTEFDVNRELLPKAMLFDSNVLILALGDRPSHPRASACRAVFDEMLAAGNRIYVATASIAEILRGETGTSLPRTRNIIPVAFDTITADLVGKHFPKRVLKQARVDSELSQDFFKYDALIVACALRQKVPLVTIENVAMPRLASEVGVTAYKPEDFEQQQLTLEALLSDVAEADEDQEPGEAAVNHDPVNDRDETVVQAGGDESSAESQPPTAEAVEGSATAPKSSDVPSKVGLKQPVPTTAQATEAAGPEARAKASNQRVSATVPQPIRRSRSGARGRAPAVTRHGISVAANERWGGGTGERERSLRRVRRASGASGRAGVDAHANGRFRSGGAGGLGVPLVPRDERGAQTGARRKNAPPAVRPAGRR